MTAEVVRCSVPTTPQTTEALNMIDEAVQDANQILTNLVAISHDWEPEWSDVNLEALLSVTTQVDPNGKIKWHIDVRIQPPTIRCDRSRMNQVFLKLLQNSFTAMQGRGDIFISATRKTDADVIEVRDTGPGISRDVLSTVFEPFVTTKRAGMGLGLTYCREVLRRHGGAIQLIESPSPGAAFLMTIPTNTKGAAKGMTRAK
jgi:signal transduction histidine kinase